MEVCGWREPRIVVATDASEASEKAVDLAVKLAEVLDGELHAISVVSGHLKRQDAENAVELVRKKLDGARVRIVEGNPAKEIVTYASEIGADLIVTGSHNHRGFGWVFIGSVSEKVVRHAETSVLVARSAEIPERVLIATDGSEYSKAGLECIRHVREVIPLRVTVLHVMDTSDPVSSQLFFEELQRRRDEALLAAKSVFGDMAEYISLKGHPASVISEVSAEYDLIVLGSHGRGGIDHLLLGSVAERAVRFSKSSALVVRGKKLNTSRS